MELTGRAALVTGGAGGLGGPTVRRLAGAGLRVVVFDRDADGADALAAEFGEAARAVPGDVLDDDDVGAAIAQAQAMGPLSVIVNLAGGGAGGAGGGRTVRRDGTPHDKGAFVRTVQLNVLGTFNVTRLAAVAMAPNAPDEDGQRGVVINTGSIAGLGGLGGQIAYSTAKAAIIGMTLPLALDLAPLGIRVCCISPGTMATPLMVAAVDPARPDPTDGMLFPKRMGHPDEFAQMVESIIRNPYLNGENIRLDGGVRVVPQ
jgi:NAD(P)-dependent dehydrogenase (short-subunit alcohol dehydrogenase family)